MIGPRYRPNAVHVPQEGDRDGGDGIKLLVVRFIDVEHIDAARLKDHGMPNRPHSAESDKPPSDKFRDLARELGCDEDESG